MRPMDPVTDTSPFDPTGVPSQNGSVVPAPPCGAQLDLLYKTPEADRNHYAFETGAEFVKVLAYGDAVRSR